MPNAVEKMSQNERVRYHQFMAPRHYNPTYTSSNVGASVGMFMVPTINPATSRRMSSSLFKLPKAEPQDHPPYKSDRTLKTPTPSNSQPVPQDQPNSKLSNYGTSSLKKLNSPIQPLKIQMADKMFNERTIYEKQQKKYNIISMQPKQYRETIKKYPKYRLENMDVNYQKRLSLQGEYMTEGTHKSNTASQHFPIYARDLTKAEGGPSSDRDIGVSSNHDIGVSSNQDNGVSPHNETKPPVREIKNPETPDSDNKKNPLPTRTKGLKNVDELSGIL